MTTEETITQHSNRINRASGVLRQPFKPWERLKALDDIEASVVGARRILLVMERQEKVMSYGPDIRRNDEIGRMGL